MLVHLPRRTLLLVALLLGALAAAWRPMPAQRASTQVVSLTGDMAATALAYGHGLWCQPHLSDRVPAGHRSPSWHGAAGRRTSRSSGGSPIMVPAGSILALDPFIRQHLTSFVRCALPPQSTGRSAVAPRAPPAVH